MIVYTMYDLSYDLLDQSLHINNIGIMYTLTSFKVHKYNNNIVNIYW